MTIVEAVSTRSLALRSQWLLAGVGQLLLLANSGPKLTPARIEAARGADDRHV